MELLDNVEPDPLTSLEERIKKAAQIIPGLRQAKEEAEAARDKAMREAADARAKYQALLGEVEELRQERSQVRSRIEKLLGHMDVLSGG